MAFIFRTCWDTRLVKTGKLLVFGCTLGCFHSWGKTNGKFLKMGIEKASISVGAEMEAVTSSYEIIAAVSR